MDSGEDKDYTSFEEEKTTTAADKEHRSQLVATATTQGHVGLDSTASVGLRLEELRNRARMHVQEHIRLIPVQYKVAYMEAMAMVPDIVASETDSVQFLRICNYDVWAAARRLVLYWEIRKEVFGDRAFLPLILTGDGALSNEDILQLRAGFPATLPKSRTGLQVVYLDRRQFIKGSTPEMRLRCMFYLAQHVASEDDLAQTEGVLVLVLLLMPRVVGFEVDYVRRALWMAKNVLPIKFRIHVLNRLPKSPDRRFAAQDIISSYVSELLHFGFGPDDTDVFIERENGHMLDYLLELGLTREGIPGDLGGSWTFDVFAKQCRNQSCDDRQKYHSIKGSAFAAASTANDDEQTRLERLRTANAIHSRRKRDRRRLQREVLQKESKKLKKSQSSLDLENNPSTDVQQQDTAHQSAPAPVAEDNLNECEDEVPILGVHDRKPPARKQAPPPS
ncbi:hypothetical protein ACA910_013063 [Epithemia clementina (nom. ined.)]